MKTASRGVAVVCAAALAVAGVAACSSSKKAATSSSSASGSASATGVPNISASSLGADFSAMALLKPLAAAGKGMVGVLLPDTTTSARYVTFDAPYLTKAFQAAGLTSSQFKIDNA